MFQIQIHANPLFSSLAQVFSIKMTAIKKYFTAIIDCDKCVIYDDIYIIMIYIMMMILQYGAEYFQGPKNPLALPIHHSSLCTGNH
jgi:hypothetical protein